MCSIYAVITVLFNFSESILSLLFLSTYYNIITVIRVTNYHHFHGQQADVMTSNLGTLMLEKLRKKMFC